MRLKRIYYSDLEQREFTGFLTKMKVALEQTKRGIERGTRRAVRGVAKSADNNIHFNTEGVGNILSPEFAGKIPESERIAKEYIEKEAKKRGIGIFEHDNEPGGVKDLIGSPYAGMSKNALDEQLNKGIAGARQNYEELLGRKLTDSEIKELEEQFKTVSKNLGELQAKAGENGVIFAPKNATSAPSFHEVGHLIFRSKEGNPILQKLSGVLDGEKIHNASRIRVINDEATHSAFNPMATKNKDSIIKSLGTSLENFKDAARVVIDENQASKIGKRLLKNSGVY